MKKGQILTEFLILGAISLILLLVVGYKITSGRIMSYIQAENDLNDLLALSIANPNSTFTTDITVSSHPYEDKSLVTTRYFSFYVPADLNGMLDRYGEYYTQNELADSILQVIKQLEAQNISYNKTLSQKLLASVDKFLKSTSEKETNTANNNLKQDLTNFTSNLASLNSPIAKECSYIINKLATQIVELKST